MKYFFALGSHSDLSIAEIQAVFARFNYKYHEILISHDIFILESEKTISNDFIKQLGGTIKFGEIIQETNQTPLAKDLASLVSYNDPEKFYFGISTYNANIKSHKLGLELKKLLKARALTCRYVTGKENPLSSVIVKKNKLTTRNGIEFIIIKNQQTFYIGKTLEVQDFEFYSRIDYGRPARDDFSGMLPPKLAQIMINLVESPLKSKILDPFCGSGTILQMAALLHYDNLFGADKSAKAINDTKENFLWLNDNFQITAKPNLKNFAVDSLSENFQPVDFIVTEPYLGPALKGLETNKQIEIIIIELKNLYEKMFHEFFQILKKSGRVVVVIPEFKIKDEIFCIDILSMLQNQFQIKAHYKYFRENQKVIRNIYVLKKM
jgi:tRNA G10  N-methylase Trm11